MSYLNLQVKTAGCDACVSRCCLMHYWIIQPAFPADMTEPDLNELFVKFSSCSLENYVLFKDVVLYREAEVL